MRNITLIVIVFFLSLFNFAQQVRFGEDRFYELIVNNHPLSKQANLKVNFGENSVLKARGAFDPKLFGSLDQKYYNSSQYYDLLNAGLKVPTWFGLEFKTGFENNRGAYVSEQNNTPPNGLWYGGVSMNLGQGLIIDNRRAELFKAKIYAESTFFEKELQLNELIFESGYSYWNWFLSYHSEQTLIEAYDLALERFNAVKRISELGDRPSIDTVEAIIQLQNRESLLLDFKTERQATMFNLNSFLWDENANPLELDSLTIPIDLDSISQLPLWLPTEEAIDSAIQQHPYLQIANFKIKSLEVDKRLKREMLKPTLDLQYNLINEPINSNPINDLSLNNYKWGVTFEMPLFLRKERGDLQLANLKIQDQQFELDNKKAYIEFKIRSSIVEMTNALRQVEIYKKNVKDAEQLLNAEKQMFENGESSLFLINARETSYIQSKLKLIESLVKSQQSYLSLQYALANLI
ncbi:MAG: TolC family protein [Crocinitomicaceae bacterium]|nr:TolC family protein [Crocinitomicaceae bacterium]